MLLRATLLLFCCIALPLAAQVPAETAPSASATQNLPDPIAVRAMLREALGKDIGACAIAVLRRGKNTMVVGTGALAPDGPVPDDNTIFEIGSITKVFSAALWRLAVQRSECNEATTLGEVFGTERVSGPGAALRLADLACHHSGLPRMPSNFKPARPTNPYADYTLPLALEELARWKPATTPASYAYSNYGFGLLGSALAERCGKDWTTLVRTRIAEPLGMKDTCVQLSEKQGVRYAQPRTANKPFVTWTFACMAGAGALKSSGADMLRFLQAQESCADSELLAAFESMRSESQPASGGVRIGWGWHQQALNASGATLVWHNGGTGGSRSFCGFIPGKETAVVVLANCSAARVDETAIKLAEQLQR